MVRLLKQKFIGMKHTGSARKTLRSSVSLDKRPRRDGRPLAVCLADSEPDLTRGVVYELIPDKKAASHRYVRVVDDSGEDYLYPAAMFLRLRLRHASQRALVK